MGSSLVFSIEQNLRRAVSEAEWKLPKHACFYVCLSNICSEVLKQVTTIEAWPLRELCDFGLKLETVLAKAQVEVSTYLMPQMVTGEGYIGFHCEWDNLNRTTTSVHENTVVNSSGGIMLTNKPSIVQLIDKNKLRWFGLVMRREERVNAQGCDAVKYEGKETNREDDVATQHRLPPERKKTSLKEVLQTKCFENRHD